MASLLTAVAVALTACGGGGGGGKDVASTGTSAASDSSATTSTPASTTGATVARRRLPGPPGPVGPGTLLQAIGVWHPLAEAGVPGGDCRPLLDSVQGRLGRDAAAETGGPPYVALYRGIAQGCLGQLQAARTSLGQARQVGLGPDETSKDRTCNAQQLLAFGFATYLNEEITPRCPPATTTTTRASTTTRVTTTTTRATTTTRRTSTPTTR